MNKAKINLKNTQDQVEMIQAMVSPDGTKAGQAKEAFAKFIGPIIQQVLNLMGTANLIYTDWPYNEDDLPMFPLDQYYLNPVGSVKVWQQNSAGGLGSSLESGLQEMPITTYRLDTAVSWLEKTIRRGRLPYVSLGLNRAAQELLRLQERNAWLVALRALAEARTKSGATTLEHLIQSTTADVLQLDDFNRWLTRAKRINTAFDYTGTPEQMYSRGATDAFLSPEMMEQIRGFVYQPMNTRSGAVTSSGATALALPDATRQDIYNNAGLSEVYGITLHEMLEFGINQRYNTLFGSFYSGALTFSTGSQEIIVGVDRSRDALIRPIAQNADYGSDLVFQVDDQWPKRAGKLGFFGALEEGRAVIDARALTGLIIQ
jgi:hypothetical protein